LIYLRLLGAAVISVCAALLGMGHTYSRRQAANVLADIAAALRTMSDEVYALQTPIPQMLRRFAQSDRPSAELFALCLDNMQSMPLGEAWSAACAELALSEDEKNELCSLYPIFMRINGRAQSATFRLAADRLDEERALRLEKLRREGKTPAALGACIGIMCAIVLF